MNTFILLLDFLLQDFFSMSECLQGLQVFRAATLKAYILWAYAAASAMFL